MGLDTVFFLVEIIIGYMVNSLALIADSFHMLNDLLSLAVALWAVNVAKTRMADAKFTYGWLRAEILGALANGVFLLALCFTIFVEAIQRFINPPIINNPKLILFVGALGLCSNIVGVFLFHDTSEHSHSHSHSHPTDDIEANTNGISGHPTESTPLAHATSMGSMDHTLSSSSSLPSGNDSRISHALSAGGDDSDIENVLPSVVVKKLGNYGATGGKRTSSQSSSGSSENEMGTSSNNGTSHTADLGQKKKKSKKTNKRAQSLNMQGVLLHVIGDCVGNIGVMLTAVFIWKTDYSWRFYFDPLVSLVITCIIFSTAMPLCKSSSRILLQGSPVSVDSDEVKDSILSIPEVISVHDFHIWNLTETYLIATLHVDLNCPPEKFLTVAANIKSKLHNYGIHSATIQPEFSSYYFRAHMLPERYSSSTQDLADSIAPNSAYSATGNGTNEPQENHSCVQPSNSDIHCLVDASAGCTTYDCMH